MLPAGGVPLPVQVYVSVTTIWVAPDFTLKPYDAGPVTERVTVTSWLFEVLAAWTTTE
jgi:hypothetical protein